MATTTVSAASPQSTSSSSANSGSARHPQHHLDQMVISYLHEKGLNQIVQKLQQQLNIPKNANNFLPSGTLAAAVAGTRRNERKRPSRETSKPKSAYDLFVLERKVKYPNMGNTTERRQLIRQEWYNETEEGRKKYEKKRDELREEFYKKFPEKRPAPKPPKPVGVSVFKYHESLLLLLLLSFSF